MKIDSVQIINNSTKPNGEFRIWQKGRGSKKDPILVFGIPAPGKSIIFDNSLISYELDHKNIRAFSSRKKICCIILGREFHPYGKKMMQIIQRVVRLER